MKRDDFDSNSLILILFNNIILIFKMVRVNDSAWRIFYTRRRACEETLLLTVISFTSWSCKSLPGQEPITRSEQRSLFGWDIVFTDRVIFSFDFEDTLPLGTPRFPPSTTSESESTSSSSLLDSLSHSSELSTLSYSLSQDKSLSNSSLLSAMFIKVGKSR